LRSHGLQPSSVVAWLDQRIRTTEFNAEQALSKDIAPVDVDAVVFWQVHDAERAALEITDYRSAIARVAQKFVEAAEIHARCPGGLVALAGMASQLGGA
jgi:regulator of protease activity HflC (stomatin/prohibitin superfamily)